MSSPGAPTNLGAQVLATDTMQFPRDPMQAYLDDHIYFSKEASTGGSGVGGGGCGCN